MNKCTLTELPNVMKELGMEREAESLAVEYELNEEFKLKTDHCLKESPNLMCSPHDWIGILFSWNLNHYWYIVHKELLDASR